MITVRLQVAAVLCAGLSVRNALAQSADKYQRESAYLYRLAETAEWPERVLPKDNSTLVICAFGGDRDFHDVLRATLTGKSIRGHPLEVRYVQSAGELKLCHVAFIRSTSNTRELLDELKNTSVLSVGEEREFLAQGGMIGLTWEGKRIHFELNPAAIDHANIRYRRDQPHPVAMKNRKSKSTMAAL
jgi:YfiR/HmsC-like